MSEPAPVEPASAAAPETTSAINPAPDASANGKTKAKSNARSKKAAAPKEPRQPTRTRPPREPRKKPELATAPPPAPEPLEPRARATRQGVQKPTRSPLVAPIKIPKGKKGLAHGTIVWAKMTGFPWYPGTVFAESDGSIPSKVKSQKPDNAVKDKVHLIRFVGEKNRVTWGWIPAAMMQTFNEGDADSKIMQNQRYKNQKERRDVKTAHRKALQELDAGGGPAKIKATKDAPADDEDDEKEDEEPMDTTQDDKPEPNGDAAMEDDSKA